MKNWWKTVLKMALPLLHTAGEAKRDEDDNDTGADDAIGFGLEGIADIGTALLTGDAAKVKAAVEKVHQNVSGA